MSPVLVLTPGDNSLVVEIETKNTFLVNGVVENIWAKIDQKIYFGISY